MLIFFAHGYIIGDWTQYIPTIVEQTVVNERALGVLLGGMSLGTFIGVNISRRLINCTPPNRVATLSFIVCLLLYILIKLTSSYSALVIMVFFFGVLIGLIDVSMNTEAASFEKYRGKVLSKSHGLWSIGAVLGAFVTGVVNHFEISVLWIVYPAMISLFLFFGRKHEKNKCLCRADDHTILIVEKRKLAILVFLFLTAASSENYVADWSAYILRIEYASGYLLSTMPFLVFTAFMACTRMFGDYFRDLGGDKTILKLSLILSLVGFGLISSSNSSAIVLVGFVFSGVGLANILPIVTSISSRLVKGHPQYGISIVSSIALFISTSLPVIAGYLGEKYSLQLVSILFCTLFVFAIFFSNLTFISKESA